MTNPVHFYGVDAVNITVRVGTQAGVYVESIDVMRRPLDLERAAMRRRTLHSLKKRLEHCLQAMISRRAVQHIATMRRQNRQQVLKA
jgi:hypothetical protein